MFVSHSAEHPGAPLVAVAEERTQHSQRLAAGFPSGSHDDDAIHSRRCSGLDCVSGILAIIRPGCPGGTHDRATARAQAEGGGARTRRAQLSSIAGRPPAQQRGLKRITASSTVFFLESCATLAPRGGAKLWL